MNNNVEKSNEQKDDKSVETQDNTENTKTINNSENNEKDKEALTESDNNEECNDSSDDLGIADPSDYKPKKNKNEFISKNIEALKADINNFIAFSKRVAKPSEGENRIEILKEFLNKNALMGVIKRPLSIMIIAIVAALFLFTSLTDDKKIENQNLKSLQENQEKIREIAQKDIALNEMSDIEKREIEKEMNKSIEAEKELAIMENNATAISQKASQDIAKLDWNKRVMKFFINEKDIQFNLIENGDRIAVIMDNFKQEPENQNRITGIDARVSKIVLVPGQNDNFLDILLEIESVPPTAHYVLQKRYPLLNHIKLDFYDDAIVKTTSAGETILTIGDKILPYMTIKNIGRISNNKIFADIEINQSHFNGENFTHHYEIFK